MNNNFKQKSTLIYFLYAVTASNCIGADLYYQGIASATGKTEINDYAIIGNPINLAKTESSFFSLSYSPSLFNMPELSPGCAIYGHRFGNKFAGGFSVTGLGNKLYNEISGMAHASYNIEESISFAVSLEYSRISIRNYKPDNSFKIHLGGLINISDFMSAGFCLRNITGSNYNGGCLTTERIGVFGLNFAVIEFLNFELASVIAANSSGLSLSAKYDLIDMIHLRLAYLTNPMTIGGGISIHLLNIFNLSAGISYNNFLGYSQQYCVSFYW